MDYNAVGLVLPVVVAIFGWVFGSWLNSRRDTAQERRKVVSKYLINVYRVLTQEVGHRANTPESIKRAGWSVSSSTPHILYVTNRSHW